MDTAYETVNASDIIDFKDRISYRTVNTAIALMCVISNLIGLAVFLGYRELRMKYVLLIQLSVADLIYSISTVYTGFEQIQLYSTATSTLKIPLKTSAECALDIGLQSKLIGDVLIAMTILWMGMERFIAIMFPFFYRISVNRRYMRCILLPLLSGVIVIVVLLLGLMCVLSDNHSLTYNCGRKSTFGTAFSAFIYISCIVSNLLSTTLNAFAYAKARATMKKNP
ncbi:unnamed protein product [Angiostrongylus costaricensis]|uniref:G_PROTEIN_RECEP_F1_2 domain-containing protein n=1 Tax=Angiostrongylus costaricensis TaxID=334426 RepID=A0A0R3PB10_ANGCS|nr:unnamed protein product [Angiostrongylus costaricensis]